jgi:type I restriction enzyme M protein
MSDDLGTPALRLEREGPLAWCVIDRPSARNALTPAMYYGVKRAVRLVNDDPDLAALIITGVDDVFAPGGDLGGRAQLIDGRNFWVPMKKSLGNKRRKIGDAKSKRPEDKNDPDHIGDLTRIYDACKDGTTRKLKIEGEDKKLVISKVFDNEDFGFHKITVERPLRLNFQASEERIALLEEQSAFKSLATSKMKNDKPRLAEIAAGKKRQQVIRDLLIALSKETKDRLFKDRELFLTALKKVDASRKVRLSTAELKVILTF